jgi:ABC-type Fe3+/spermidine/putrescine transport system ATPase subunit
MGREMGASVLMVEFRGVTKRFGPVVAVDAVSFAVRRGEFCSVLGPSGCGKTTSLRMVAGFERPDQGEIFIGGAPCTHLPPYRRNTAMVFQGFALFPHRSVLQNVSFGLRMRKMGTRAEITARAQAALKMVGLEGMEERFPRQLSGGQQQRVALARALVLEPAVLLLDEPLASLDLKLRRSMRYELKQLQRRLGITTIYVTHDQEEALSMSDSVVVMNRGRIEQIGSPEAIYLTPASAFVANFIGESNVLSGTLTALREGGLAQLSVSGFPNGLLVSRTDNHALRVDDPVWAFVRAESVRVCEGRPDSGNWVEGEIVERSFIGGYCRFHLRVSGLEQILMADFKSGQGGSFSADQKAFFAWDPGDTILVKRQEPAGTRLQA